MLVVLTLVVISTLAILGGPLLQQHQANALLDIFSGTCSSSSDASCTNEGSHISLKNHEQTPFVLPVPIPFP
jgi:preprotein translocase subunit SecG